MKPIALARLILRLDGIFMLFGALVETTTLGPFFRAFGLLPGWADLHTAFGHDYAAAVLRLLIQVMFAAVLVGRTDTVLRVLLSDSGAVTSISLNRLALVLVRQVSMWMALSCIVITTYAAPIFARTAGSTLPTLTLRRFAAICMRCSPGLR